MADNREQLYMTTAEIDGIERIMIHEQLEDFKRLPWEALSELASTIIRLKKRYGMATSRDKFHQNFLCYARREKQRRNGGGLPK